MAVKVLSNYTGILGDIKANKIKPVYILHGEEEFFIDHLCDQLEQSVVPPDFKDFNQVILYGNEVNVSRIVGECRRFPMMAPHVLVMVKEAQNLSGLDELVSYLEKPSPTTVLVLAFKRKKLDKRTKLYKAAEKHVAFEAEKLRDNQVPEWLNTYLASRKIKIEPRAQLLLVESVGSNLQRAASELDKIMITLESTGSQVITEKIIEENVGISREFNIFELQEAIGLRQFAKAMTIVDYFSKNKKSEFNNIIPALGSLFSFFMKIYKIHELPDKKKESVAAALGVPPFYADTYLAYARNFHPQKLDKMIKLLHEYDLKSKGMNNISADSEVLYRELMVKIFASK